MKWAKQTGFTIVELLIVIVVIGILAAITIVAFNGVQDKARTAAVQSDMTMAAKKITAARYDDASELYPAALPFIGSTSTTTTYTTYNGQRGYCAQTTSNTGSVSRYITADGQSKTGTCNTITNLVTNPSVESGTAGWGAPNAATYAWTADTSLSGAYLMRYTAPSNGVDSGAQFPVGATFTSGTKYTASFTLRAVTAGAYSLSIQGTAGVLGRDYATMTAGQTRRFSFTWTPTATGGISFYALRSTPFSGANTFDIDAAMVYAGDTLYDYADPSTNTNWTWTGTAHGSTSTGPGI